MVGETLWYINAIYESILSHLRSVNVKEKLGGEFQNCAFKLS